MVFVIMEYCWILLFMYIGEVFNIHVTILLAVHALFVACRTNVDVSSLSFLQVPDSWHQILLCIALVAINKSKIVYWPNVFLFAGWRKLCNLNNISWPSGNWPNVHRPLFTINLGHNTWWHCGGIISVGNNSRCAYFMNNIYILAVTRNNTRRLIILALLKRQYLGYCASI